MIKKASPYNMKSLKDLPSDVAAKVISYIDFPSLLMLKATNKFLLRTVTEEQLHSAFLDLKLDYMHDDKYRDFNDEWARPCDICPGFVGEDTHEPKLVGLPLKKCESGRKFYKIRRPGAIRMGECIEVQYCEKSDSGGEHVGMFLPIHPKCWAGEGRTRGRKRELGLQFCKRYGHWLRLVWKQKGDRYYSHKAHRITPQYLKMMFNSECTWETAF